MLRLEDLTLFVRASALNSFSETAREAGLQPAQVSTAIKRLEKILNVRLFARSTRSLRLTPEGENWLPYAIEALQALETGMEQIQPANDEVRGVLQIAVPSDLGRNIMLRVFQAFRHRHPALQLKILFSDQIADVFKDPVDIAFRYGINDDASFVALPLAPNNRRVIVASPGYLERFGAPKTVADLAHHNALTYLLKGRVFDKWTFTQDGNVHHVAVKGSMMSDDAEVIRRLAISGEGIAFKSWLDVSEDVAAGRLKVLLEQYQGDAVPLSLICPHRKQLSATVRLLHEAVKQRCDALLEGLPQ
ncbi:LysR family transcriptional regulator [Enterobacteriaceae bacterium H11S18]|uniref:LysR family transcriptional regulator n=1 Tax=Dryocola clanedunensis TaxID=2925396 RepID=UPI0022F14224|nr:LysR family transcriptional regulator [Dryocola clanedunensis]MCT4712276.1 LysR family transcriptional regulator [Dryocola clanedunensis]